jgi:putative FmdB family regulatory protein
MHGARGARARPIPDGGGDYSMPIYEYHCEACGHDFECLILGGDKPACSACRSRKVRKRMSACGFVSKGRGGAPAKRSAGSSCGSCHAGSCAGCKH